MKTIFTFLLAITVHAASAQQPFEGTIHYRQFANTFDRQLDTSSLVVHFGKSKIRVSYERKGLGGGEDVIVDLDSGCMYELHNYNNTYSKKELFVKSKQAQLPIPASIAGYRVTMTDLSEKGVAGLIASMSRGQVLIYPSPDLYFPVKEELKSNIALSMVFDNKIVLGVTIIDRPMYDAGKSDTLRIEAVSVNNRQHPASFFEIPPGYLPQEQVEIKPSEPIEIITHEEEEDTIAFPHPPPPMAPNPPHLPPPMAPKPPVKKATVRPVNKKASGDKSPMRKQKK